MKHDKAHISRSLQVRGRIFKLLIPYFTERKFRLFNRFLDRFLKGHWMGKHTKMEQYIVPRADDSVLRLCVCRAKGGIKSDVTGLLWLHGGGYALGLPEQDYAFIDRFAASGDCLVVSPDYCRSTQRPYPAALEDCYTALKWMADNAKELGIRPDQIFIGGDSAGGGLCAAVCLYAKDKGEVSIAFQMPLYPMLNDRLNTNSATNNSAPIWNSRSNKVAWQLYLRNLAGSDAVSSYAAPARATDLRNMPPTCTYVGSIEPFHDETVSYVKLLQEQGVQVYFKEFAGCYHAFDIISPGSSEAKEAIEFLMQTFWYAQAKHFAPQPVKAGVGA